MPSSALKKNRAKTIVTISAPTRSFTLITPPPPSSPTPSPYTTLFRSEPATDHHSTHAAAGGGGQRLGDQHVGHRLGEGSSDVRGRHLRTGVLEPFHHRSEEHTSELQSRGHLVCRLLL